MSILTGKYAETNYKLVRACRVHSITFNPSHF